MSYLEMFPPKLLLLEEIDCQRLQRLIDKQRRENPTDAHLQLVMDRQQQRLDERKKQLAEHMATVVVNN